MKAITLRVTPELARVIGRKASEMKASLNRAVIRLLEEAVGMLPSKKAPLHRDLDRLAGTWSRREAEEFDRALDRQRAADPELWK